MTSNFAGHKAALAERSKPTASRPTKMDASCAAGRHHGGRGDLAERLAERSLPGAFFYSSTTTGLRLPGLGGAETWVEDVSVVGFDPVHEPRHAAAADRERSHPRHGPRAAPAF